LWAIKWKNSASKQLRKLDEQTQERILSYLEDKILATGSPRQFGEALTGNLSGFWRYRIGDYRLICRIQDHECVIMIVKVAHRREVYH
jgi:mRNA interferase RelE/StbE